MQSNLMVSLKVNAERLETNFNQLAQIGATVVGGVNRLALSNEDLEARAWLADKLEAAGILVRDDDAGNLSGILLADDPEARTLIIGAHMDSVPDGGRYDPSVGVLAAIECLMTIKEAGLKLPFHLEVINFTDEEGCWQSLFGSRAITGKLDNLYEDLPSVDSGPFRAALFRAGIRPRDIHKARRNPQDIVGYIELNIEQGARLHNKKLDIGIVAGVVGRTTYEMTFYGEASHSGTTSVTDRRDALLGASRYVCAAYDMVAEQYPLGILNCGNLVVSPGAFNIVPDKSVLTVEFRHPDQNLMSNMESALIRLAHEEAMKHRLSVNIKQIARMPAAVLGDWPTMAIERACIGLNVNFTTLISYAGHDAQIMSSFTPSGMIFIPSVDGISHNPREFSEWRHVVQGAEVLLHSVLNMAQDCDS